METTYWYYFSKIVNGTTFSIDFNITAPSGCTEEMLDAHAKDVLSSIVQDADDWILDEVVE